MCGKCMSLLDNIYVIKSVMNTCTKNTGTPKGCPYSYCAGDRRMPSMLG